MDQPYCLRIMQGHYLLLNMRIENKAHGAEGQMHQVKHHTARKVVEYLCTHMAGEDQRGHLLSKEFLQVVL